MLFISQDVDCFFVGCIKSSGKYRMHVLDENRLTIYIIGRPFNGVRPWWRSGKFGLRRGKSGYIWQGQKFDPARYHQRTNQIVVSMDVNVIIEWHSYNKASDLNSQFLLEGAAYLIHTAQSNGRPTLYFSKKTNEDHISIT